MLTQSSLQLIDTQKYSLSFLSALKRRVQAVCVSPLRVQISSPSAGLALRVTMSPQLQYQDVYCSLTEESSDQLQPSQETWKEPCAEEDSNLNWLSSTFFLIAMPTDTQPLMPSILNLMDFFCVPMAGSISAIRVYSLSGSSGILTFLGSTSLSEWCSSVGEKRQNLLYSALGLNSWMTYSPRFSTFLPPVTFSLNSRQISLISPFICRKMPWPVIFSSRLRLAYSSNSAMNRWKLSAKSTIFLSAACRSCPCCRPLSSLLSATSTASEAQNSWKYLPVMKSRYFWKQLVTEACRTGCTCGRWCLASDLMSVRWWSMKAEVGRSEAKVEQLWWIWASTNFSGFICSSAFSSPCRMSVQQVPQSMPRCGEPSSVMNMLAIYSGCLGQRKCSLLAYETSLCRTSSSIAIIIHQSSRASTLPNREEQWLKWAHSQLKQMAFLLIFGRIASWLVDWLWRIRLFVQLKWESEAGISLGQ